MIFRLNRETRQACVRYTGYTYQERSNETLDSLGRDLPQVNSVGYFRQIAPRGSVYLQAGRMSSSKEAKKIIHKF